MPLNNLNNRTLGYSEITSAIRELSLSLCFSLKEANNSKPSSAVSSPDNPEQSSHVPGTSSPSLASGAAALRPPVPSRAQSSCALKSNNKKKNRVVFTRSRPSSHFSIFNNKTGDLLT